MLTSTSRSHFKDRAAADNHSHFGLRILWAKAVQVQKERLGADVVLSGAKTSQNYTEQNLEVKQNQLQTNMRCFLWLPYALFSLGSKHL